MQLQFAQTHLSITSFPNISLPAFTVITGPNGAGKTHFLQALMNGSIRTDIAQPNTANQDIRLFDWTNMVPQDGGGVTSETLRQERQGLQQQFMHLKQQPQASEPLRNVARTRGFPQRYLDDPFALATLDKAELETMLGVDPALVESVHVEIAQGAANGTYFILNNLDINSQAALNALAGKHQIPVIALTPRQVTSSTFANWGRTDLFQQSFARLFVAYRDAALSNDLAEFNFQKGRSSEPFLSPDEFLEQFGPPPWDFVNTTIQSAGLDFSINEPIRHEFAPYAPALTKNSTGATIPFGSLSSGEKILMSFAFCVYYANDRRQLSVYPKLLLFDEIDAPLHPSMTRSLIDTITETLVKSFGIHVVMATHSPSTVALAPKNAVHVMTPNRPGLSPTTKSEALNLLTVGVPTVAISYDGRRQVFVESPSDAKTYESLYKLLKPILASERSLEFIATGTRSHSGAESNTGCDVVKRIVGDLAASGNQSVFGLIDYDGKHHSTERLIVLGDGTRDGIENYLLDPLLIAFMICREFKQERHLLGVDEALPYPALLSAEPAELQRCADAVSTQVFQTSADSFIRAQYRNGLALEIDARWSQTDDHELEGLVTRAFPFLHGITKQQAGRLLQRMIATVLNDAPGLMPIEIETTLLALLERPAHH